MKRPANRNRPRPEPASGLAKVIGGGWAMLQQALSFAATPFLRVVQVVLTIIIGILHPQFRWLWRALLRSAFVRRYLTPLLHKLAAALYEPYFAFLRSLPPYLATVSIALPLAILEPAKLYATILIAERPRVGIVLWLVLQGLSVVLIDKTWDAVRPQARKIWLVSRLHAWGWLMFSYGKHWVTSSAPYRAMRRWVERLRAAGKLVLWRMTQRYARR